MNADEYHNELEVLLCFVQTHDDYRRWKARVDEDGGGIARSVRERKRESVRRFAARLQLSASYLSKLERGLEPLSPDLARRLLAVAKE